MNRPTSGMCRPRLSENARTMVREAIDAFVRRDEVLAQKVNYLQSGEFGRVGKHGDTAFSRIWINSNDGIFV